METHDFKYNKVPLFARKTEHINTSMFAAPKLALVPVSRYYCDVTWSYQMHCGMTRLHRSNNGLLAQELVSGQPGMTRKNRSTVDHVMTITSIIEITL